MVSRSLWRVFLDTNVLFSGAYAGSGVPRRILDAAAAGAFEPVASATVIQELVRNVAKKAPGAMAYLEDTFRRVRFEMAEEAPAEQQQRWLEAGLGSDAPIVAAALEAEVDYFCTGDARLLQLGRSGTLGGLNVVSPGDLLALLEGDAG
ncbi:MAG: PIN domain-containing protein [Dehalococcoidia bacterium]